MLIKYIVLTSATMLVLAALFVALDGRHATAQQNTITIPMGPGRDGSQTGTAVLTEQGTQTIVAIDIQPAMGDQASHVHDGACPSVGTIRYPLNSVVNGRSTTTLNVELVNLQRTRLAINVHRGTDITQYTSCGNIPTVPGLQQMGRPNGLPRVGDYMTLSKIVAAMLIGVVVFVLGRRMSPS